MCAPVVCGHEELSVKLALGVISWVGGAWCLGTVSREQTAERGQPCRKEPGLAGAESELEKRSLWVFPSASLVPSRQTLGPADPALALALLGCSTPGTP